MIHARFTTVDFEPGLLGLAIGMVVLALYEWCERRYREYLGRKRKAATPIPIDTTSRRLCEYCRADVIFFAECQLYMERGEARMGPSRPIASTTDIRSDRADGYEVMTMCVDPQCARVLGCYQYTRDGRQIVRLENSGI